MNADCVSCIVFMLPAVVLSRWKTLEYGSGVAVQMKMPRMSLISLHKNCISNALFYDYLMGGHRVGLQI